MYDIEMYVVGICAIETCTIEVYDIGMHGMYDIGMHDIYVYETGM